MGGGAAIKFEQCLDCSAQAPLHSGVIAATLYNDASRKLILSYKHGAKIALAPLLAQLLAARIPDWDGQPPLLVPVPLHRWRIWRRGFNQAAMLAREIAKRGKGELLVDGLVRTKRTPSLGGLGQEERQSALTGAIGVRLRAVRQISGRGVILVDDVLTSGATSDACARELLDAGASSVRVACFARVVDGRGMGGFAKQTSVLENGLLKENQAPKNETPEVVKTPGAT
jgi:ComF family protein